MEINEKEEEIKKLVKVIKKNPKDFNAYYKWGDILYELGNFEDAIEKFKKVIEIVPDHIEAFESWGDVLLDSGKHSEAIEQYQRVIELEPNQIKTNLNLGCALLSAGKYEEASERFIIVINLDPQIATAYFNCGNAFYLSGRVSEAIEKYKKAIELNPNYIKAYNNLGSAYSKLGETGKAIEEYKKAIELDPENEDAIQNLRKIVYELKRKQESTQRYFDIEKLKILQEIMTGRYMILRKPCIEEINSLKRNLKNQSSEYYNDLLAEMNKYDLNTAKSIHECLWGFIYNYSYVSKLDFSTLYKQFFKKNLEFMQLHAYEESLHILEELIEKYDDLDNDYFEHRFENVAKTIYNVDDKDEEISLEVKDEIRDEISKLISDIKNNKIIRNTESLPQKTSNEVNDTQYLKGNKSDKENPFSYVFGYIKAVILRAKNLLNKNKSNVVVIHQTELITFLLLVYEVIEFKVFISEHNSRIGGSIIGDDRWFFRYKYYLKFTIEEIPSVLREIKNGDIKDYSQLRKSLLEKTDCVYRINAEYLFGNLFEADIFLVREGIPKPHEPLWSEDQSFEEKFSEAYRKEFQDEELKDLIEYVFNDPEKTKELYAVDGWSRKNLSAAERQFQYDIIYDKNKWRFDNPNPTLQLLQKSL